jgi:hypothetical protein
MEAWFDANGGRLASFEPASKATHYSMCGGPYGKVLIKHDNLDSWLEELGLQLQHKKPMFWAEKKTQPVFKLFVDLDISTRLPDVPIIDIAKVLHTQVIDYFTGETPAALVATSTNPDKPGCHITWGNIYVDSMTALAMRDRWIQMCEKAWPKVAQTKEEAAKNIQSTWSDIVDKSVYTSNGLRMLWCQKNVNKPHCYVPHSLLEGKTSITTLTEQDWDKDRYKFLKMASIRTSETETTLNHLDAVNRLKQVSKKRKLQDDGVECKDAEVLFDMMRHTLPSCYRDAKLEVWKKSIVRGSPCWRVRCESKFCINVNREHTSSNVWFQVTPHEIRQRCYCGKDTLHGRNFSACKDFISPPIPFRPKFTKALQELR